MGPVDWHVRVEQCFWRGGRWQETWCLLGRFHVIVNTVYFRSVNTVNSLTVRGVCTRCHIFFGFGRNYQHRSDGWSPSV